LISKPSLIAESWVGSLLHPSRLSQKICKIPAGKSLADFEGKEERLLVGIKTALRRIPDGD
jgi:hypothetical protein